MKFRNFIIALVSAAAMLPSTLSFSQELPFQSGEKLNYTIVFISTEMVSLSLDLTECKDPVYGPAFHAASNIKTYKFWDGFYKMRDVYETWFVADKSMRPINFHRDAKEGRNYESEAWLDWNRDASEVKVKITKKDKPTIDTLYREDGLLRDIINCVYVARGFDYAKMEDGHRETVLLTPYRDILELKVRMVGREQKKIGSLGYCNTIKLALAIKPKNVEKSDSSGFKVGASEDGAYLDSEKIFMWMSDDENHVPLYFQAPASIGSIKGRLVSYEGLKYPLDCKVPEN